MLLIGTQNAMPSPFLTVSNLESSVFKIFFTLSSGTKLKIIARSLFDKPHLLPRLEGSEPSPSTTICILTPKPSIKSQKKVPFPRFTIVTKIFNFCGINFLLAMSTPLHKIYDLLIFLAQNLIHCNISINLLSHNCSEA